MLPRCCEEAADFDYYFTYSTLIRVYKLTQNRDLPHLTTGQQQKINKTLIRFTLTGN